MGGGPRRAVEAVHLPAQPGRAARVLLDRAQRVEGDERVVRPDLHPQVAVAARLVEVVGVEVRQRVEGGGALLLESRTGEEAVAEAEGDRQRRGARVPGHIRVVRGRGLARHQPLGRRRPAAQQGRGLLAPRTRGQVERDEVPTGLHRGGDAGLMFPVKHHLVRPDRGQRGLLLGEFEDATAYPAPAPTAPRATPVAPAVPMRRRREMPAAPGEDSVLLLESAVSVVSAMGRVSRSSRSC